MVTVLGGGLLLVRPAWEDSTSGLRIGQRRRQKIIIFHAFIPCQPFTGYAGGGILRPLRGPPAQSAIDAVPVSGRGGVFVLGVHHADSAILVTYASSALRLATYDPPAFFTGKSG